MQITMDEFEIKEAVANHVRSLITIPENHEIGMDFTAGRGENGLSVALKINAPDDAVKPTRAATPVPRPKAVAKASVVEEVTDKAAPEPTDDVPADVVADTEEGTTEEETTPSAEAPPNKPRSIFSKQTA